MNDPHVSALKYRLSVDEPLEFCNPPDVLIDTPEFTGLLSKAILSLHPKAHFETELQVKPISDAFVHAWEIEAGLRYGHEFHFQFEGCEIVDRKPTPGAIEATDTIHWSNSMAATLKGLLSQYPAPPNNFLVTAEVETLWARYCRYKENKESLVGMAYYCYSYLKTAAGSNRAAAWQFGIQEKLLTRLRELSSERGDMLTARKVTPRVRPLSEKERDWIESAVKAIIRQLGTRHLGGKLMMADLPSL